jgi:hypothetical protein
MGSSAQRGRFRSDEERQMIGCLLFGAGFMMVAKMIHRHHCGWGHRAWGHCGTGWHGRWGGGGFRGNGGWGPANDDGYDEYGPGFGHGHGPHWLRSDFREGFVARVISDRLEATPAQERVIREATEEFREALGKLRGEGGKTRADVATAFRKSNFDEVLFGELFARHDDAITGVRKAFVGMGARIHDALDEKQRARLADMIESGPRAFWGRPRTRGWS